MLETFYSKINSFNSEVKGRINKNNTSDSLIKIIEYMDIYRKRLKTINVLILDYQRKSHKTLRAYEVRNKPNNTKASKKKQRKKQLNQILKKIIKLN